jgi:hypothetical protein
MHNVEKYNYQEFKDISMKLLVEREYIEDRNLATAIIDEVWRKRSDNANIRDVIKIARLTNNMNDLVLVSGTILT